MSNPESIVLQQKTPLERVREGIDSAEVPKIHFNGFINSIAAGGDVLIMLESNGKAVAILNASYTVAKSFAISLTQLLKDLEKRSGNEIMTASEVEKYLRGEKK